MVTGAAVDAAVGLAAVFTGVVAVVLAAMSAADPAAFVVTEGSRLVVLTMGEATGVTSFCPEVTAVDAFAAAVRFVLKLVRREVAAGVAVALDVLAVAAVVAGEVVLETVPRGEVVLEDDPPAVPVVPLDVSAVPEVVGVAVVDVPLVVRDVPEGIEVAPLEVRFVPTGEVKFVEAIVPIIYVIAPILDRSI